MTTAGGKTMWSVSFTNIENPRHAFGGLMDHEPSEAELKSWRLEQDAPASQWEVSVSRISVETK